MSDYIIHAGTGTIISADEAYFLRTDAEFEEVEELAGDLPEDVEWVPNLFRTLQLVRENSEIIGLALSDYRQWFDTEDDCEDIVDRIDNALKALETISYFTDPVK